MNRAYTYKDIANKNFATVDFEGVWLAHIGRPELSGSWFVYGGSGHGKTSYQLQLTKYLCGFAKVHINTLEEGMRESFRLALDRAGMAAVANKFTFQSENYQDLNDRLKGSKPPAVVVIDSMQYFFRGLKVEDYWGMLKAFPKVLFIFISHAKGNQPEGAFADDIRYHSDVKIFVKDYLAQVQTSRYGGCEPYVIWEAGYHRRQMKLVKPKETQGNAGTE